MPPKKKSSSKSEATKQNKKKGKLPVYYKEKKKKTNDPQASPPHHDDAILPDDFPTAAPPVVREIAPPLSVSRFVTPIKKKQAAVRKNLLIYKDTALGNALIQTLDELRQEDRFDFLADETRFEDFKTECLTALDQNVEKVLENPKNKLPPLKIQSKMKVFHSADTVWKFKLQDVNFTTQNERHFHVEDCNVTCYPKPKG